MSTPYLWAISSTESPSGASTSRRLPSRSTKVIFGMTDPDQLATISEAQCRSGIILGGNRGAMHRRPGSQSRSLGDQQNARHDQPARQRGRTQGIAIRRSETFVDDDDGMSGRPPEGLFRAAAERQERSGSRRGIEPPGRVAQS